jgi:hypothetical protein
MEQSEISNTQSPAEMYLAELPGAHHQEAILAFEIVAGSQGISNWRLAQWDQLTAEDLPALLTRLRATFTSADDVRLAVAMIKGAARCAWRQKVISGQQLAVISKWKIDT